MYIYICSFITAWTMLVIWSILFYLLKSGFIGLFRQFTLRELFAQCLYNFSYFILLCSTCSSIILWQMTIGNTYSRVGSFSLRAHAQKLHYFYFRSEICCQCRSQPHWFPTSTEILTIWQSVVVFRHILVRMRRNDNFRVFGCNSDNVVWFSNIDD